MAVAKESEVGSEELEEEFEQVESAPDLLETEFAGESFVDPNTLATMNGQSSKSRSSGMDTVHEAEMYQASEVDSQADRDIDMLQAACLPVSGAPLPPSSE